LEGENPKISQKIRYPRFHGPFEPCSDVPYAKYSNKVFGENCFFFCAKFFANRLYRTGVDAGMPMPEWRRGLTVKLTMPD
jgi:hypothetical protein